MTIQLDPYPGETTSGTGTGTGTGTGNGRDNDIVTVRRWEDSTYLRTWLRRWLALLIVAGLATSGFMIAIDIAMARVDSSMSRARDQAIGVARNTNRLPFILAGITKHLESINQSLQPIPQHELQIAGALRGANQHLAHNVMINRSIRGHQQVIDDSLTHIQSALTDTESRLASILRLNTAVRNTLAATQSSPNEGTTGLILKTAAINRAQRIAEHDSGNILALIRRTNGHLYSICTAPQMEVLGGFPPC
ncbi:MAG TPA: hypothetical protein VFT62_11450 [Mycobacteriales bacterium]|nr:hypothetical protein [Mycobacteriales bacterium]